MVMPMMPAAPAVQNRRGERGRAREDVNQLPETAAMPIVVSGENVSGITLVTRRGGRVNGRFVADTGVVRPLPRGLQRHAALDGARRPSMQMSGGSGNDADFQLGG